jgi:pimeloyl-ACP methyl ester carboxylesterase
VGRVRAKQRVLGVRGSDAAERRTLSRRLTCMRIGRMGDQDVAREILVEAPDGRTLGVSLGGDPDGAPLFWLHGTPGSRKLRHDVDEYRAHGLWVCTYDRPGYGLSTPRPGRTVAQVADDVRSIADALGWDRFGVAGVSGGGAPALATAAGLPARVKRCAAVVAPGPATAPDLDFLEGMDDESRESWEKAMRHDTAALEAEWDETVAWVVDGMPGVEVSDNVRTMLAETLDAAGSQGVEGFVDDLLSLVRDWDFRVQDVVAPTRIMLARDDTSVPVAHADWLVQCLPNAELIWVDGDHFGPRAGPEMELMAWVGHGSNEGSGPVHAG